MTKKHILKFCGILAWSLLSVSAFGAPPNVVIIYADDLGFGDLGANVPESKIETPNLDQLATEGMRFTDGHSSSGVCTPSRFAMLMGQHHWRRFHGIVGPFRGSKFEPSDFTMPKLFKNKGYNTACIGKWHLGWGWDENATIDKLARVVQPDEIDWVKSIPEGPLSIGFDYYYGDGTINYPPFGWIENDRMVTAPTMMLDTDRFPALLEGPWGTRDGPMTEDWNPYEVLPSITDKAVAWIGKQSADQPFFLYFSLPSPHVPVLPNKAYQGKTEVGAYGDFVLETDAMCGRILQALKENGFGENTVVVFSSDNGPEHLVENRLQRTGHWSSGPLRGLKRDLYEGGHRVPFLVRWPGVVEAGAVSDENISQVDLFATFASILDTPLKPTEAIDSYNLVALLKGKQYEMPLRHATVQNTYEGKFALRQGDWMYIDTPSGSAKGEPESVKKTLGYTESDSTPGLLYNLEEDLSQHHNRYAEYPKKVGAMKALLDRYRQGEASAPHATAK